MESVDCAVVGAGWFGLAVAKTYVQLHPENSVVIFDAGSSVGGTWAKERLYPGLKSNNMLGTYQYPDFPMHTEKYGVKPGEHIPGPVVHQYLSDYADRFDLTRRIRLDTFVTTAKQADDGWILTVKSKGGEARELSTRKLVVATGLTSDPHMPTFVGAEDFGGEIFHSKEFATHGADMDRVRHVVVLGGSKSAWDVAYAHAMAGAQAHIVIRESGRGPGFMAPAYVTPFKKWLEKLVHTRFLTWFSPCVWGDEDGYVSIRNFLHGTWLGRAITSRFWGILNDDALNLVGYDKHPETRKLRPRHAAFWVGSLLSIINYPTDFMELVREGQIKVHIAHVDRLSKGTVHLSSGETVPAEVLVCATGWHYRPPIKFITRDSGEACAAELGLPYTDASADDSVIQQADATILSRFPSLSEQPPIPDLPGPRERRFALYRFTAPPALFGTRSLAFAGLMGTITTAPCAQLQALWIAAFFAGKLTRQPGSVKEAQEDAALHARFCRFRHPAGYGPRAPEFVFEAVPYCDMLLKDLGLNHYRKGGGFREATEPYGPEDYAGVVEEWQALQER